MKSLYYVLALFAAIIFFSQTNAEDMANRKADFFDAQPKYVSIASHVPLPEPSKKMTPKELPCPAVTTKHETFTF